MNPQPPGRGCVCRLSPEGDARQAGLFPGTPSSPAYTPSPAQTPQAHTPLRGPVLSDPLTALGPALRPSQRQPTDPTQRQARPAPTSRRTNADLSVPQPPRPGSASLAQGRLSQPPNPAPSCPHLAHPSPNLQAFSPLRKVTPTSLRRRHTPNTATRKSLAGTTLEPGFCVLFLFKSLFLSSLYTRGGT